MRRVTCHAGRLQIDESIVDSVGPRRFPHTDALPILERGHLHELLTAEGLPRTVAALLSRASASTGAYVWCGLEVYPPALAAAGVALDRVYAIRPRNHADLLWVAVETMRCPGVGVTIAAPDRLTAVEARRLQLAAERGGGVGLLIRRPGAAVHAARTRWLVQPERGDPFTQRWRLQLVHGHGRPINQTLLLEMNRETHSVRATALVADRPREAASARTA